MLCFEGAIKPYCLSLFSAITVMGTDILSLSLRMSCPKTPRICSNRKATSRPRFSPASVITEKCGERTSIHLVSSLANAPAEKQPKKQIETSQLKATVPIRNLRITEESFPKNASTPMESRDARPRPLPFALAPAPRARYTLVRDLGSFFPPCLDRLDARPGLRPDVPDALLRCLAGRGCPQHQLPERIATAGDTACAPLSFSRRNFLRSSHRQTHSQGPDRWRNHPQNGAPWRGDPRLRTSLPAAGISDRMGMGPLVRLTARRRTEHHRPIHDPDGANLRNGIARVGTNAASASSGQALARPSRAKLGRQLGPRPRPNRNRLHRGHSSYRLVDSASLHHLETDLAALATRILHRRMPQPGGPAALALPSVPLGCIRFRRTGCGIYPLQ